MDGLDEGAFLGEGEGQWAGEGAGWGEDLNRAGGFVGLLEERVDDGASLFACGADDKDSFR